MNVNSLCGEVVQDRRYSVPLFTAAELDSADFFDIGRARRDAEADPTRKERIVEVLKRQTLYRTNLLAEFYGIGHPQTDPIGWNLLKYRLAFEYGDVPPHLLTYVQAVYQEQLGEWIAAGNDASVLDRIEYRFRPSVLYESIHGERPPADAGLPVEEEVAPPDEGYVPAELEPPVTTAGVTGGMVLLGVVLLGMYLTRNRW